MTLILCRGLSNLFLYLEDRSFICHEMYKSKQVDLNHSMEPVLLPDQLTEYLYVHVLGVCTSSFRQLLRYRETSHCMCNPCRSTGIKDTKSDWFRLFDILCHVPISNVNMNHRPYRNDTVARKEGDEAITNCAYINQAVIVKMQ